MSGDDVRVWTCRLDAPFTLGDGATLEAMVSASEAERATRFHFPRDRASALLTAAFVRHALAAELGAEPLELRFTSACGWCGHPWHGKPRLVWPPAPGPLDFNSSHADGIALLAVSTRPVGIDVERRHQPDLAGPRRLALTPEEQEALGDDGDEAVLRLWTRKEAYLKGIGKGLVHDPSRVSFTASEAGWCRVVDGGEPTTWRVRSVAVGAGWVAAVAVDGDASRVTVRSWEPSASTPLGARQGPRTGGLTGCWTILRP